MTRPVECLGRRQIEDFIFVGPDIQESSSNVLRKDLFGWSGHFVGVDGRRHLGGQLSGIRFPVKP